MNFKDLLKVENGKIVLDSEFIRNIYPELDKQLIKEESKTSLGADLDINNMHINTLINRLKELQRIAPNSIVVMDNKKITEAYLENGKINIK